MAEVFETAAPKRLPESEFEIMAAIWAEGESVTSDLLMERLNKNWKKTTLLSLLTRLCERGFLRCEKDGRHNLYTALVREEDYVKTESASFLKRIHKGSVARLVASLYDGKAITKADLDELESFIREAKEC